MGLDTFGVAVALGVAGLSPRQTLRLSLIFAGFEGGMPLAGVAIGSPLGHAIGRDADFAAAAVLAALGLHILLDREPEAESTRLRELAAGGWLGVVALGVSVSIDELAIGFSAGLLRLPVLAIVVVVALQAFAVTQVGARLGRRVGPRARDLSERGAGAALLVFATALVALQLTA